MEHTYKFWELWFRRKSRKLESTEGIKQQSGIKLEHITKLDGTWRMFRYAKAECWWIWHDLTRTFGELFPLLSTAEVLHLCSEWNALTLIDEAATCRCCGAGMVSGGSSATIGGPWIGMESPIWSMKSKGLGTSQQVAAAILANQLPFLPKNALRSVIQHPKIRSNKYKIV